MVAISFTLLDFNVVSVFILFFKPEPEFFSCNQPELKNRSLPNPKMTSRCKENKKYVRQQTKSSAGTFFLGTQSRLLSSVTYYNTEEEKMKSNPIF